MSLSLNTLDTGGIPTNLPIMALRRDESFPVDPNMTRNRSSLLLRITHFPFRFTCASIAVFAFNERLSTLQHLFLLDQ